MTANFGLWLNTTLLFKYNYELHDIVTRSHDRLHLYPTRTSRARNVLRRHIPELLNKYPEYLMDRIKTHSLHSISYHIKCYLIDLYSYDCSIIDCYICNKTSESDNSIKWKFGLRGRPLIIGCRPSSRSDNIGSGRWFGPWFPRYSTDTNGLITPRKLCSPCYISLYQLIFWWMYRYWLQWPHRYQSECLSQYQLLCLWKL